MSEPKYQKDQPLSSPGAQPTSDPGSAAFQQGFADRTAWENWFNSLGGDYRLGALYWSGERSKIKPGTCYGSGGQSLGEWTGGCGAAQQRFAVSDTRRHTDPQYWFGWNAYPSGPESGSQVSPGPPPASNPPSTWIIPNPPSAPLQEPPPESRKPDPRPPPRPKPVSLEQMLAKCDRAAQGGGQLTLPGLNGDVVLDRCYRGRDHLACTINALVTEARSLNDEYEDLVSSNYPDLRDSDALCRIDRKTLAQHASKAQAFDERREMQKRAFAGEVACIEGVRKTLVEKVQLPDLTSDALLKSLFAMIHSDIGRVSAAQHEVLELAEKIEKSQRAMVTIQKVHRALCRQEAGAQ